MASILPDQEQHLPSNTAIAIENGQDNKEQLSSNPSAMTTDTLGEDLAISSDRGSIRSSFSSCSSLRSENSTLRYTSEPFTDFKARVERLCVSLWLPPKSISRLVVTRLRTSKFLQSIVPPPKGPIIERLKGGDYNRITGITLPSSYGIATSKLILRNSRSEEIEVRPDRDVAILEFVRQRTTIPVPKIITTDFTNQNALAMPYVIQERIPGGDINSIWDTLSHKQRCTIACEMGCVIKSLLSLESRVPGFIEVASTDTDFAHDPNIVPFELRNNCGDLIDDHIFSRATREPENPGAFFKRAFGRWHAYARGDDDLETELLKGLLDTAYEMDKMSVFPTDMHCLCHVDLHSRNIMAEVRYDGTVKITAVLDWDEAVFAPKFVNCHPPWWLWEEEGDDRLDETGWPTWPYELPAAVGFPKAPEKQELKRIFEESAGPEYTLLANDTCCRLGRAMFILAREGLKSSMHFKAAERIMKEWQELRNTLTKPVDTL